MKASSIAIVAGLSAVAVAAFVVGLQAAPHRPTRPSAPRRRSRPKPPVSQSFKDTGLRVAVEKPRGRDWAMADDPCSFHGPLKHPAKVLEIRREPRTNDGRFAIIELYVIDMAAGASDVKEVEKLEGQGLRAKHGTLKVVEEGPFTAGGRSMARRVVLWDARGTRLAHRNPLVGQTRIFSLRTVHDGKLYVLLGATSAEHYEALLPEFEQTFKSLRIG